MEEAKQHDGRQCSYGYADCGVPVEKMEVFVKERVYTDLVTGESYSEPGEKYALHVHNFCAMHKHKIPEPLSL